MTLRVLSIIMLAGLLAACETRSKVAEIKYDDFKKAIPLAEPAKPVKIVKVAKPLPLPGQLKKLPKKITPKHRRDKTSIKKQVKAALERAKYEPVKNGYINAMQVYPYTKGALYKLYAAVSQVSAIELEPGEQLTQVTSGDTKGWVIGNLTSGSGEAAQYHVLVKPRYVDLKTNLIIATDRRSYHLELVSGEDAYMSSVSWTYPETELVAFRSKNSNSKRVHDQTVSTGILPENLNFRYRIEGDAPWRPVHVFDDGKKVFIQFPSGISQGDAPPLFVQSSSGERALVNYRVKGKYYVVDRLFAHAELRLGKKPQKVVRITRRDAVWK